MTFYDLSIPNHEDQNENTDFSQSGGGMRNKIKRYAMPMVIKNKDRNKVRQKEIVDKI